MKAGKIIGAALAAALAAGALTAAPVTQAPGASAAVAVTAIPTKVRAPRIDYSPWIEKSTWPTKTAALGKTVSFTVKATGEKLKYQWYIGNPDGSKFRKVSGKSAKTKTLKVKVTSKTRGKLFYAKVWNSKGSAKSGVFRPFEKKGTVSKVTFAQAGLVGKFRVATWDRTRFESYGWAETSVVIQNVSKGKAKPSSTLRFAYRAPGGKLYPCTNRNLFGYKKPVTLKAGEYYQVSYVYTNRVPASAKGGHWVVWSTSNPSHKMALISPRS